MKRLREDIVQALLAWVFWGVVIVVLDQCGLWAWLEMDPGVLWVVVGGLLLVGVGTDAMWRRSGRG